MIARGGLLVVTLALAGCSSRPADSAKDQDGLPYPVVPTDDVDILFVIDNSPGSAEEQQNLSKNFARFVEALQSPKLAGRIPNLHLGVVSSDLGAGPYVVASCDRPGGDGAQLQAEPRLAGCTPPTQPFIVHDSNGTTNVPGPSNDPIQQVINGFQCIAELGTGGCGFEHPIESVRRALDPTLNVNPGFVRNGALLVIVFLTDEDDCSAQRPELFDPSQTSMADPLGPLTSFRCFEFGVTCDINDRTQTGPRKDCKPAYDWLVPVEDYVSFFKALKPPGQVVIAAIAGPAELVEVKLDAQNPALAPSCRTPAKAAAPAIRIKALVDAFGTPSLLNPGLAPAVGICSPDYRPAMKKLGGVILEAMGQT